jgi:ATP-dependent RNA helicase DeaD
MDVTQQTDTTTAATFDELSLSDEIKRALDEIGYVNPTPVQLATYELAASGRDLIVQARTGTGKTAAFAIPLLDRIVKRDRGVQALVLAPTRELALQSAREITRIGKHKAIRATAIYGGAPMGRQIDELAAGAQIVSGTPGRVLDHLRRGTLDASGLRALVLDEMDEMLSMGFARELNAILELIPDRTRRQTMCFSATVDGDIRRHAERHMKEPQMVSLSSDAVGAEAVTHFVYTVSGSDRIGDLIKILEVEDPESAIIFCNMRSETEQVAAGLKQAGFDADWLNGDLPQRDREKVMSRTREGRLRYLVATDVAARGIDISHLTHVINYSFPESAAVYVHRTGRTGRAGRTGCAISLVAPQELGRLYYLRLEYKISPVERSLPSRGELQTRQETDRVALLSEAFAAAPRTPDLALARRLLTHPEVERIVGGLLQTFFGAQGEAVDEQAAAARRARAPRRVTVAAEPESEPDDEVEAETRDDERPLQHGRRRDFEGGGERRRDRARDRSSDRPRERDRDRERPRRAERPVVESAEPIAAEPIEPSGDEAEAAGDGGGSDQLNAVLYLDIGRRDGARVSEIAKLMREVAELRRSEVGRIRIRDRHTFVEVPDDKMDHVLSKLKGHAMHDKTLSPERAKTGRT